MKKRYLLFFLCFVFALNVKANNFNSDLTSKNLDEASKNIASGIKSFNFQDFNFHVNHAKNAVVMLYSEMQSIQCNSAIDLSQEIAGRLDMALESEELVTGRYHLKLAEPLMLKLFYEYELCTTTVTPDNALANLEAKQAKLKEQQLALAQQAKNLKLELEKQQVMELALKKEQFITLNKSKVKQNVKAFNEVLSACGCNAKVDSFKGYTVGLSAKTTSEIKAHYLNEVIKASESYIDKLRACKKQKPQL